MKLFYRIVSIVLVAFVLIYWEFLSDVKTSFYQGGLIPPFSIVIEKFTELASSGILLDAMLDSLRRFCIGLFIGGALATIFGLLLGRFSAIEISLEPFIALLRPISPIAWLPIIALMLGIGEIGAIFVIIYAVFFPILMLTINGVRQIDKTLLSMAKNFNASEWLIFRKIILPGAFLHIASGFKLAASVAWIYLVAGEMLGVQSGLGYLIIDGRNIEDMAMVIVAMIFIGLLGFVIHCVFNALEKLVRFKFGGI